MNNVRIGIIGSGFMAKTHGISIQNYLTNAVLSGIAGGSRVQNLAHELNVEAFPSVKKLVASDSIDAVIITSPHDVHYEHAMLCSENGKHLLLEKPMATSPEQCRIINQKFSAQNLKLMIAFTQRYRQSNKIACDLIQSGKLGKILMMQEWGLVPGGMASYPSWQAKAENLGTLFGYGIHNIDKLRWILNSEVDSVYGQILSQENGVETSTIAILKFKNGISASLWTGVDIQKPGFPGGAYRSFISCENGLLDVDGYGAVKLSLNEQDWETVFIQPAVDWKGEGKFAVARMGSFNAQNQDFVDSILKDITPPITGTDGEKSVEIVFAIYKSARENKVIAL